MFNWNFFVEIYAKPPGEKIPTNKIIYYYNNEIWSIDLSALNEYKQSNIRGCSFLLVVIGNFPKEGWTIALEKNIVN